MIDYKIWLNAVILVDSNHTVKQKPFFKHIEKPSVGFTGFLHRTINIKPDIKPAYSF